MSEDGFSDSFEEPNMEIQIETLMGTSFEMRVCATDTIRDIKQRIQRVEGIPSTQQNLIYRSEELKDYRRLCDAGIKNGAKVKLVVSMRGGPISTRRLSPPCEHHTMLKELKELLENTREELGDKLAPGSKVSVLVFKEGDVINLLRVIENEDGSYSPYSEKPLTTQEKRSALSKVFRTMLYGTLLDDTLHRSSASSSAKYPSEPSSSRSKRHHNADWSESDGYCGMRRRRDQMRRLATGKRTVLSDRDLDNCGDDDDDPFVGGITDAYSSGEENVPDSWRKPQRKSAKKSFYSHFLSDEGSYGQFGEHKEKEQKSNGSEMEDLSAKMLGLCASGSGLFSNSDRLEDGSETEEIALKDKHRTKPTRIVKTGIPSRSLYSESKGASSITKQLYAAIHKKNESSRSSSTPSSEDSDNSSFPLRLGNANKTPLTVTRHLYAAMHKMNELARSPSSLSDEKENPLKGALSSPLLLKRSDTGPFCSMSTNHLSFRKELCSGVSKKGDSGGLASSPTLGKSTDVINEAFLSPLCLKNPDDGGIAATKEIDRAITPTTLVEGVTVGEAATAAATGRVQLTRLVLSENPERPKTAAASDGIELVDENTPDLWELQESPTPQRLKHASAACNLSVLKHHRRPSFDCNTNAQPNAADVELCSSNIYHHLSTSQYLSSSPSAIPPQYAPKDDTFYYSRSPLYGRNRTESGAKASEKLPLIGGECSGIQRLKNERRMFAGDRDDILEDLYGYCNIGCGSLVEDAADFFGERVSEATAPTAKKVEVKLPPLMIKKKARCSLCNKKLNITNIYNCRCGKIFCAQHRYSEVHHCNYDYKTEGRRILEQQNPLVVAEKIHRI